MSDVKDIASPPVEMRTIDPAALPEAVGALIEGGGRMQMAYALRDGSGALELRYLASGRPREPFLAWRCRPKDPVPSVAAVSPLIGWYEREITDLFGVRFTNQPEPYPLVLHRGAHPLVPPLDPGYPGDTPMAFRETEGAMPETDHPDIQKLPFGPVRADVVESAQFIFLYVGEHILHLQPQLFFKHRGMEKRFEGKPLSHGVILAERVSGVGGVAHALAFCQAVEQAAGCAVPLRARMLRSLLAELERLYNHLHYFGHLADTTTLKVGQAEGKLLEERVKQIGARLTGSRFLRGLLTPGGLRRDLDPGAKMGAELDALRPAIADYLRRLDGTNSYLDRLISTGILSHKVALDQGATGPIERASGIDRDLRRDHPYGGYAELCVTVPVRAEGDAHARARVRMAEIDASLALIERVVRSLPDGPVREACVPRPNTEGLGWAESPRGSLYYAVHIGADGRPSRVKIKSPSYSNWRTFPFTVHDSNLMDYAINEASFGLTVAGCDR
ncbi:hydrogenase large subunit [Varunaivibrio sulfuroxidans]|uniref:Ni,Fe-hydrogenase III large subunit n=1 Tax=Varunaivibrio sulfuroxidans TaxID=1773489 RepID=A0A4R3JAQ6_9PROT|nr:nickel-dependent hydrogenase large subunit [Varunaivibrio sulfuroxidans]TCS63079.1 Ni,Fe-hydrogenase III large subunit [Varunaivibrio sulfuroxidans]WES31849.1 nickel-dependent hydrogenase large subunit [Varunaivibrio sulfuroxidans]